MLDWSGRLAEKGQLPRPETARVQSIDAGGRPTHHPEGQAPRHGEVVIAEDRDVAPPHLGHDVDHGSGIRPVTDEVAEKHELVGSRCPRVRQAGGQRLEVGVHVAEQRNAHRVFLAGSAHGDAIPRRGEAGARSRAAKEDILVMANMSPIPLPNRGFSRINANSLGA